MAVVESSSPPNTRAEAGARLLLVGEQGLAARPYLETATILGEVRSAQSILEGVLISVDARAAIVLVDVSNELPHLEEALRSLRHVNPLARIVLL